MRTLPPGEEASSGHWGQSTFWKGRREQKGLAASVAVAAGLSLAVEWFFFLSSNRLQMHRLRSTRQSIFQEGTVLERSSPWDARLRLKRRGKSSRRALFSTSFSVFFSVQPRQGPTCLFSDAINNETKTTPCVSSSARASPKPRTLIVSVECSVTATCELEKHRTIRPA